MDRFLYHIFGVFFGFPRPIPELKPADSDRNSDVRIVFDPVPDRLKSPTDSGVLWQVGRNRFLLDIPGTARYLAEDGETIRVEPAPEASEADVRFFLFGTPLAASLMQRGLMVLRSSAVAVPEGAVLIAGNSGSGKSTLAAALMQRGYPVLSDNLTVVTLSERGRPVVIPGIPQVVLWADALDRLGLRGLNPVQVRPPLEKYGVPAGRETGSDPVDLHAVYILSEHHKDAIETEPIEGIQSFRAFGSIAYNTRIADALSVRDRYFQTAVAVVNSMPVYRIRRPKGLWSAEELADRIETEWA